MKRSAALITLGLSLSILTAAGCGLPQAFNGERSTQYSGQSLFAPDERTQVRIFFKDVAQIEDLGRHGVDLFENVNRTEGYVDATVNAKSESYLKASGLRYTVTQKAFALRGLPSGYFTLATLSKDLQSVASAHPDIVRLETIGTTLENRPITAVRITSHPERNLPAVLINSGDHARELPPVELTAKLIHQLTDNYGHDATITRLVDTRDIWIIPVVNPDGRNRVEQGNAMWRKNTHNNGDGTLGVDPNRNADDHFHEGNDDTSAQDYRGKAPFSEKESAAIRDLFAQYKFTLSLDIHCYSGMVLWPPGYTNALSKDDAAFRKIGKQMADRIGYQAGTIAQTIYHTYGDLATWQYNTHGTLAFAVELDDSGFSVPYSQVNKDWQDWKDNFTYFIGQADRSNDQPLLGFKLN